LGLVLPRSGFVQQSGQERSLRSLGPRYSLGPLPKTLGAQKYGRHVTKQELFDNVYKLIKLLKPEFYNKITWAVVVAGLAILSTSLIDKLINAVFKISFNIEITDGNDAAVGITLVVIGLFYHVLSRKIEIQESSTAKKEQNAKRSEHDIKVFNRTNEIMDETELKNILDWI
jgi:hypothetical protein